jgi:molecular chaperone GrpE (heat shock protein)
MNNENKEDILEVEEGVHIQQTKDADKSNEISFEETNEEGSMSEERRKDEKLASQGSQKPNDDEISFEVVNEDGETDIRITIKKLREKIKKLEQEKQEYLDLSQRTRADYVNYKREVDANRVSDRKFATKRFIEELLPVLDSYDMAQ